MRDAVTTLLERLHTYRDHVADAYHNGSIVRTDENRRAIETLQQHRVLVPHASEVYRLHSTLRRFLDSALNTQRIVHGSADIGAIFVRLETLTDSYIAAFNEDAQTESDAYEDEIAQAVFEIADGLQSFITNLQASIDTRFAAVSSVAAKLRQNLFYLDTTHTLVQTLEAFHFSEILDRLEPFPRVADLLRHQLFGRLPVFRDALQSIYQTLRQFLFEYRKIEARARRVQEMWLYLRRNPDYEPRAWDNAPELPPWIERASGFALSTHPDVNDAAAESALTELAQIIPPSNVPNPRKRKPGVLVDQCAPEPVRIIPRPHSLALRRLLRQAKEGGTSLSARQWRNEHAPDIGIDEALWLELVLDVLTKGPRVTLGVPYRLCEKACAAPFGAGNAYVFDVELG